MRIGTVCFNMEKHKCEEAIEVSFCELLLLCFLMSLLCVPQQVNCKIKLSLRDIKLCPCTLDQWSGNFFTCYLKIYLFIPTLPLDLKL